VTIANVLFDFRAVVRIVTGLLYVDETAKEIHELNETPAFGLNKVPFTKLCPGSAELAAMQADFR
jgi:hypothetical protein